ncbi:PROTEIN PHOSPHATASE 2C [Salix koriyanagi]|uniref:protein-serine/threonine phosphatase n=1 Tax=Salix koriyanagi TaxID=2511006 RepID=A0A9Q0TCD6_9ROSI|nr:PROTEIN PHOSPHATASE 2C [Salix koriyanagi]
MAASLEFSPPFTLLEGGYNNNVSENLENLKQSTNGKPPCHLRQSMDSVRFLNAADLLGVGIVIGNSLDIEESEFFPAVFRSGSCAEGGPKQYMEDEHVCIDNLVDHLSATTSANCPSPGAFYGVFDGHGEKAIESAFVKADYAFADESALDISSGTTALTALIFGRTLVVANAGDCRAVLGRRGRAIEMSKDHKPNCSSERLRIEKLGGVIYDGYLNGQLSVARALGDWHMKGPKGSPCPLSAEPELQATNLTEDDEFLIMGCDGLWDVMSSQCAVTIARKELMLHNDPERCSRALVREALRRNACDNLTVIVICFSQDPPPSDRNPTTPSSGNISAEDLNLLKGILDRNS